MNGDIAISLEGLGKRYRLGQHLDLSRTFRETLASLPRFLGGKALRRAKFAAKNGGDGDGGGDREFPDTPPDTFWALRDVSCEVPSGEVVGVIGRNGAGKTTLLKILSRITEPTAGKAKIRGRVGSLLEVGTGFHPELTGRENVYLNGAILGMRKSEIRSKFDEIVAFAEIEKFLDTPVKRYSSGMYVRLAFAVAAHLEPEILLVDEVLAVGDASFQKKCLGKMGEVAGGGRTILFVSHNMAAVETLCQKALLLEGGRLKMYDDTHAVVSRYLESSDSGAASVDTRNHHGRRAKMVPTITSVRIIGENGIESSMLPTGEEIVFEIGVDPGDARIQYADVSVSVMNHFGQQICKLATWAQSREQWDVKSPSCIRCQWPGCNLSPGVYSINVGFASGGVIVDYIDQVASFEIIPSESVFSGGRVPPGVIAPSVQWVVVE
jgi:lipopolysaccharide transport system ATP-binding protein